MGIENVNLHTYKYIYSNIISTVKYFIPMIAYIPDIRASVAKSAQARSGSPNSKLK